MKRKFGIAFVLGLGAVCLYLAMFPRSNPVVDAAERLNEKVALASAATYTSLRAINAALSTAQEVEIGGSAFVTGYVQPLKWLEPVDDTVEMVSGLIFSVAVITGILSIAVGPLSAIGFVLLSVGLFGRGLCAATPAGWDHVPPVVRRGIGGCSMLGLTLAVALPLAFALGTWIGESLTRSLWTGANATLSMIASEARALIGEPGSDIADRGWRETVTAYFGAARMFWSEADALLKASLTLIGIYFLRILVLPVVLLLAGLHILRRMMSSDIRMP